MKKHLLFIHGGDSFDNYDDFLQDLKTRTVRDPFGIDKKPFWTEKLRENLQNDFLVLMPAMPNKQNAKYEEWKIWFERQFDFLSSEVILVGWSLGGMFLAKYLSEEKFPFAIKALYLLAAPSGEYMSSDGNNCLSFHFLMNDLLNLSKQVEKVNIWHSEDDFVVPYQEAHLYKKYLTNCNFVTFKDKNHFLLEEFTELIDSLKML